MSKIGVASFKGQSGKMHEFNVYPLNTYFKAIGAVYAITIRKVTGKEGRHEILYVGQTTDLSERFDDHHKQDCFDRHRANCICIHAEGHAQTRLAIEKDLCNYHAPICNG